MNLFLDTIHFMEEARAKDAISFARIAQATQKDLSEFLMARFGK